MIQVKKEKSERMTGINVIEESRKELLITAQLSYHSY
jgi:hypothetical protein